MIAVLNLSRESQAGAGPLSKAVKDSGKTQQFKLLVISRNSELTDAVTRSMHETSGLRVKVSSEARLNVALIDIAAGKFSVVVCDTSTDASPEQRHLLLLMSTRTPIVVSCADDKSSCLFQGFDRENFVASTDDDLKLAVTILAALSKSQQLGAGNESKLTKVLLDTLRDGLKSIEKGRDLHEILAGFCLALEKFSRDNFGEEMFLSVLLRDSTDKRLRVGAAPSLPEDYNRIVDGIPIKAGTGSCGSAAYLSKPVYASDIEHDENWKDFLNVTRPHSLRACWSTPVFDQTERVVATFAVYYKMVREPQELQLHMIAEAAQILRVLLSSAKAKDYAIAFD